MDISDFATDGPKPPTQGEPRPTLRGASWRGAKRGVRYALLIFGPIFYLAFLVLLIPTFFGLGARRGFGVHYQAFGAVGGTVVAALWGAVIGAVVGSMAFLIRRARGESESGPLMRFVSRPIRLFPRRAGKPAPGDDPVQPESPRRRRLWPWLVGVPSLLVLATAFGLGIYAGRSVDRRLAQAIADADRDDPNWRLDDQIAALEDVTDDENAAIVAADVLDMLPNGWPIHTTEPPKIPPADNVRMDELEAVALREDLDISQDAVRLARTLADYRTGRHELRIGPAIIDTPLPETQNARTIARLLASDAAILAHDGDIDGALNSCRAILGVVRSMGDEPFLISDLVRAVVGAEGFKSARAALAKGEASEATLARLQSEVLDLRDQPFLERACHFEMAMLDEIIRRIRDAELPISAIGLTDHTLDAVSPNAPWGKLMFDSQRAFGLEWMREAEAIVKRPASKRPVLWAAWEAEIRRVKFSLLGQFAALLPATLTQDVHLNSRSDTLRRCELGATAILLAAERHRLKTGAWPDSVGAIDSAILDRPPVDPYADGPYLMNYRDGQLIVHSIGPNLIDEQGEYDYRKALKGGPDDYGTRAWDPPLRNRPAP